MGTILNKCLDNIYLFPFCLLALEYILKIFAFNQDVVLLIPFEIGTKICFFSLGILLNQGISLDLSKLAHTRAGNELYKKCFALTFLAFVLWLICFAVSAQMLQSYLDIKMFTWPIYYGIGFSLFLGVGCALATSCIVSEVRK